MSDSDTIRAVFNEQRSAATEMASAAKADIQKAFDALGTSGIYRYDPYRWELPVAPLIGGINVPTGPSMPGQPLAPVRPMLQAYGMNVPNPDFGPAPSDRPTAPVINLPTAPSGEPPDLTGGVPTVRTFSDPTRPALLTLPSDRLPYGTVSIPDAPTLTPPVFNLNEPSDITTITLDEYLTRLTSAYTGYSQSIPRMVKDNWLEWFRAMVDENPNIRRIDGIVTTYLTMGGAGIPVPIEEAIVTRATDRVAAEQRRKSAAVWEDVAMRGLTLPSGTLTSGRKAARAESAEAVSKVATDVAIKNLELEHDHMKFMLQLGTELQKMLVSFASETGRVVTELNGQAIEMTKLVLTGMIEVNNAIVKIYLARWEGYRSGVEAFKARIAANEAQVRVYEAEIRAELAKTEVNKATVEVLQSIVQANQVLTSMYKTQIDAETAKIEADRVRVMAYEASVRGYVAKVDAWKARWDGYGAAVNGQLAVAKIYESQNAGYKAEVEAYTAGIEGYRAQVQGYTAQVQAISAQNEAAIKSWSVEFDGLMKGYSTSVDAYGRNWSAIGEQMRAQANVLGIQSEFLAKAYSTQTQIEIERSREHFSEWQGQLRSALDAASGLTQASGVAAGMANSALNSLTAFAGTLSTSSS